MPSTAWHNPPGPSEKALSAQFIILKQDGKYSIVTKLIDGTEQILIVHDNGPSPTLVGLFHGAKMGHLP
jgi:hypothetical protein